MNMGANGDVGDAVPLPPFGSVVEAHTTVDHFQVQKIDVFEAYSSQSQL